MRQRPHIDLDGYAQQNNLFSNILENNQVFGCGQVYTPVENPSELYEITGPWDKKTLKQVLGLTGFSYIIAGTISFILIFISVQRITLCILVARTVMAR
jgi:hypothetical protein